jgi:branched-chain amino acid transport system substrate-binding protein
VIALANASGDTVNAIKQAGEFGIAKGGQTLAGLLVFVGDIAALGLPTAQGLVLTETWYWDMNENNRAWTKRWQGGSPASFRTWLRLESIRRSSTISRRSRL